MIPTRPNYTEADIDMLMADVQAAQDAAFGDSNDEEIDLLRGALEGALALLGLPLPDSRDPDDDVEDVSGGGAS